MISGCFLGEKRTFLRDEGCERTCHPASQVLWWCMRNWLTSSAQEPHWLKRGGNKHLAHNLKCAKKNSSPIWSSIENAYLEWITCNSCSIQAIDCFVVQSRPSCSSWWSVPDVNKKQGSGWDGPLNLYILCLKTLLTSGHTALQQVHNSC